jgi:hypothetical protein
VKATVAAIGAVVAATAATLVAMAAVAASPSKPERLRGEVFIAGATLVDPPPDEPRDTHAYLTIDGNAARRLFVALKVADVPDLCLPGRRMKRVGHITCTVGATAADARCDFGLNLGDGSAAPGLVC